MFFPSEFKGSVGLADVGRCGGACASVFVNPFFFVWVRVRFVAAA